VKGKGSDGIVAVIGTFIVGGLWVAALLDYLKSPTGLNAGGAVAGSTLVDTYQVLTGTSPTMSYSNIAGVGG
jgi:hypothetical protein